ncbi:MAG: putative primase [Limisphaerales bacterium]|nr:MAG: putative primase [Limisphaerales bacterium]KAG0507626.1 MAG: putative primase [Limisphaerales bacterium]TXT48197.1 MAG: putative primase [Limisphaerales bacterium]
MKKPTLTASHTSKPTTSQPATLDPQTAAVGFLQTNQLAFHDDPKRFFIFVEKQQAWHPITINQLHRRLKSWVLETHKNSVSAAALKKMVAELEVAAPCWTPTLKPGQMVVANGVLDVTAATPLFSAKDQNTHFADTLTINYQPAAQCPKFRQFLADSLAINDASLVQKWAGSLLAGPNQSQVILMLLGASGTGKGTLVSILTRLVGVEAAAELRVGQLDGRFEMSALVGKRLLVGMEINPNLLNGDGLGRLKALVGNDRMEAELKGRNRRASINGDFHVVLYGNQLNQQQWSADLDAFRRRLLIVEYSKQPPATIIPNLADTLWLEEGSGILNWAVEGVGCYRADLQQAGRFVLTVDQQRRVNRVIPPPPVAVEVSPSTPPAAPGSTWRRWMMALRRLWQSLIPAK